MGIDLVHTIYVKLGTFGKYHPKLALVKSITGTYGFLNTEGKEVVNPVYAKIGAFGKFHPDLALVMDITNKYGFIDQQGKEVIPCRHTRSELVQALQAYRH
ncbi:MAG: WG repeat-containing protein [Microscillaceae bacterium]|nr:WG repeat-containing protein [Microscillaceae bacterium]